MTIHKEGRLLLIVTCIVSALLIFGINHLYAPATGYVALVCSIIFFLFLQFFRSPVFQVQTNTNHVLAPADGKVVVIEEVEETEYLNRKCLQVSIFMSPLNVHVNRTPVAGTVSYFKYHPGKYLVAWHPKSSTENERTTLVMKPENGQEILLRQIAGAVARRIRWYIKKGQQLKQGDEFGFIKFGSRVDLFLPIDCKVEVAVGQKTQGGKTILAQL